MSGGLVTSPDNEKSAMASINGSFSLICTPKKNKRRICVNTRRSRDTRHLLGAIVLLGSASCSQTSKHFAVWANEATRDEKLTLTGNVLGGARAAPLKSKAA